MKKTNEQLGRVMREIRERRGVSQTEIAKELKLASSQFISNWERGIAPVPKPMMAKLSKKLKFNGYEKQEILSAMISDRTQQTISEWKPVLRN